MEQLLLFKGVILGFSIAAPVGPIGVLCIRRTLSAGMLNGFLSGLGAATADAIYGGIAAFGVIVISSFLLENQSYLRLIGGLFLLYLGCKTFRSPATLVVARSGDKSLLGAYTSAFFLTLTNPMTIMSFGAVFAGLGVGTGEKEMLGGLVVFGVFIGSLLWWLLLSGAVNVLRSKVDQKHLAWVNQLSGSIIAGFGIVSLLGV